MSQIEITEIDALIDELQRVFERDAWHGPSLMEVLAPIVASIAKERPILTSHNVWELVVHVIAWKEIVVRRLASQHPVNVSPEDDWPPVGEQNPQAWRDLIAKLAASQSELIASIRKFDSARLNEVVPGKDYSFRVMLHGSAHHDAYHAAQIRLLALTQESSGHTTA